MKNIIFYTVTFFLILDVDAQSNASKVNQTMPAQTNLQKQLVSLQKQKSDLTAKIVENAPTVQEAKKNLDNMRIALIAPLQTALKTIQEQLDKLKDKNGDLANMLRKKILDAQHKIIAVDAEPSLKPLQDAYKKAWNMAFNNAKDQFAAIDQKIKNVVNQIKKTQAAKIQK